MVTGAADKGTWVRLLTVPVEGKLVRGFEGADVGDRLRVQLIETNVDKGFIDFAKVGARPAWMRTSGIEAHSAVPASGDARPTC